MHPAYFFEWWTDDLIEIVWNRLKSWNRFHSFWKVPAATWPHYIMSENEVTNTEFQFPPCIQSNSDSHFARKQPEKTLTSYIRSRKLNENLFRSRLQPLLRRLFPWFPNPVRNSLGRFLCPIFLPLSLVSRDFFPFFFLLQERVYG